MKQYHDLLRLILTTGVDRSDRTGTGTRSVFAPQMRFDLREGFPLLTTKKLHLKSIIYELLWILKGDTNIKYLNEHGVKIWDEWADSAGELGPVYGQQLRAWGRGEGYPANPGIDQLSQVLDTLRNNPESRRMVVSSWNVADLPRMALSPCHCLFQFYTVPLTRHERLHHAARLHPELDLDLKLSQVDAFLDGNNIPKLRLDCQLYQRSADVFLGVPFNIASYALLTQMVAQVVNMVPGEFIWTGGDTHLYLNHLEQAETQLTRSPKMLPQMKLNPAVTDLFAFAYEDFTLSGYEPYPAIKGAISV